MDQRISKSQLTGNPPRQQVEEDNLLEYIHELLLGVKTAINHVVYFAYYKSNKVSNLIQHLRIFPSSSSTLLQSGTTTRIDSRQKDQILKVVGVGYGRTGTYSLKLALSELGHQTLHTQHLHESPKIFQMLTTNVFQPAIQRSELYMGNLDLNVITQEYGFTATVDLPMALYYEQIHREYPNCKFILTTRSNSEEWFNSFHTLSVSIGHTTNILGNFVDYVHHFAMYWRWVQAIINRDVSILSIKFGTPLPKPNKKIAMLSYEEHNENVRKVIPSNQLLEYNIKTDGWEPLCTFLEIAIDDCPTHKPFPKSNSKASLKSQTIASMTIVLSIVLIFVCPMVAYGFECMTGKKIIPWISSKMVVSKKSNRKRNKNNHNHTKEVLRKDEKMKSM